MNKIITSIVIVIVFIFYAKTALASNIQLNEFMANPVDNTEWVELYNPTNQAVDLSNWKIKDGNSITSDDLTLSGQINPLSFITFDHNKGWLNDSGNETITLLDNNSQTVDSYQYNGTTKGKTYGRQPDGGSWIADLDPSKGKSNGISPSPPPTPSPSPTPVPTSPVPQPTPSFAISNVPSQINSDQSFTVSVNLTSSTAYYCKGAFKKADSSNYFGLTLASGNWIKNSSSYNNQYLCANNFNLEVKPDISDLGYTGSGDYIFKVGSYDKGGGNLTWSNEVTIKINNVNSDSSNYQSTPQPNSSISSPASTLPTIIKFSTPKPTPPLKYSYQIASVAAATISATPSAKVEVKNEKQTNPMIWIGLICIFAGAFIIGYIYLKKNAKIFI